MITHGDLVDPENNLAPIDADQILSIWLESGTPKYSKFDHRPLREISHARPSIENTIAKTVFTYHKDPNRYREQVRKLGFPEVAEELDNRPKADKTRMGNFGEILASEYLRQLFGYDIPVFRLRYNPNKNQSMKGDDVLAFNFGEDGKSEREIIVGESKVRKTYEKIAVKDGYDQLVSVCKRPHPVSLAFVADILELEGRSEKADAVRSFLNYFTLKRPNRRLMLFVVTGNQPRNPFECLEELENVPSNLIAVDLCIRDLDTFVSRLFDYEIELDNPEG
jgi:hypothetical protein